MYIHNYFSDVLLSFRILFDSHIFAPKYIRSYEFNIANRTFSFIKDDYHTQYEFPACLVTLNTDNPSFGERPTVIQRSPIENINMVPVVYDTVSGNLVNVQEEQTQIAVSIVINCESQLQAKETEFAIRRALPINKFIQLFEFTSFLEIPDRFLLDAGIDFNNHEILNLFSRLNKNTGSVDYQFSVKYKPLIKLDSISVGMSSNTQRSFPVNLDITYQIQMPMWVCLDRRVNAVIESIHLDFSRFGNEPISENSTRPVFGKDNTDKFGGKKRLIRRNLLVHELNDFELLDMPDLNKVSFSVKFLKEDFIIGKDMEFDIFDINGKMHRDVKPILIDADLNKVNFEFTRSDYNSYYNANIVKPIIIQFIEIRNQ